MAFFPILMTELNGNSGIIDGSPMAAHNGSKVFRIIPRSVLTTLGAIQPVDLWMPMMPSTGPANEPYSTGKADASKVERHLVTVLPKVSTFCCVCEQMIEFGCEFGQNVVDTRKGFRVTSASHLQNLCGGAPNSR